MYITAHAAEIKDNPTVKNFIAHVRNEEEQLKRLKKPAITHNEKEEEEKYVVRVLRKKLIKV